MTTSKNLIDVDLLIFDLDDTLVNWFPRIEAARQRVAELLSLRLSGSTAAWLATLEEPDGDLWEKVVSGEVRHEDMESIRMRRVVAKLNHIPIIDNVIVEAVQIHHLTMLEAAKLDEVAHSLLSSLGQHYSLHLLTNGEATLQWPTIRNLGLETYFEEILIASELGSYKPHPQPFQEALSRAGCPPHRACMIGDSWHDDIEGAAQLGMKTIWMNQYRRPVPTDSDWAHHEVQDLHELHSLFNLPRG